LSRDSTCFRQFVCASSGVYSLYTQQWCMSYRFVDSFRGGPSWSCSKAVYKPVWHAPFLSVQWINSWWWADELSETCRVSWQNKFVKLVHLVGFITKTLTICDTHCFATATLVARRHLIVILYIRTLSFVNIEPLVWPFTLCTVFFQWSHLSANWNTYIKNCNWKRKCFDAKITIESRIYFTYYITYTYIYIYTHKFFLQNLHFITYQRCCYILNILRPLCDVLLDDGHKRLRKHVEIPLYFKYCKSWK